MFVSVSQAEEASEVHSCLGAQILGSIFLVITIYVMEIVLPCGELHALAQFWEFHGSLFLTSSMFQNSLLSSGVFKQSGQLSICPHAVYSDAH